MDCSHPKCCPKCNKDYTRDPYWKSSLRKHLARKNPCDRKPGEKYIRAVSKKTTTPVEEDTQ